MNNEPVAYGRYIENAKMWLVVEIDESIPPNMGYIPLYTHPAKTPAKQKYDDCMKDCDEPNPVERLRFFLSCALTGQDWLDVEPFIDAISHPAKTLTDEEIRDLAGYAGENSSMDDMIEFARAILKKAQEK
jgi:hypothetical protein